LQSTRPAGAAEWHCLALDVLLRRRGFLPALCWPGTHPAHDSYYNEVWAASQPLRRTLCAILQPAESIQEGAPQSNVNYTWHSVNSGVENLALPVEVSNSYSILGMDAAQQHDLMVHILAQGDMDSVAGLFTLFKGKKFKKRPEVILPVLTFRYFIIQCARGAVKSEPPMNMVVVCSVLALAMLQPEVDRSMYLREVVGMDPMQLQCNQVFMNFLAAYQGTQHIASLLNDVCGKPLQCDPRVMYDGQWLHTLLSCQQLCLTERPPEKKSGKVLELGFPPKIAELAMMLFEELMASLPEDAQQSIQGEYAGKPPHGRFKMGSSPEKEKKSKKEKVLAFAS